MTTDIKNIVVRPKWHRWAYLLIGLIGAVFLYMVLTDLTTRVNQAVQSTDSANERAETNAAAVDALAAQVERLGGTPVVDPSDLPEPEPGAPGATGETGATGATGLPGQTVRGPAGARGPVGTTGAAGADGAPGATVVGQDGVQGPVGPAGPIGPVGPEGPAGPVGPEGPRGADGATGPAGQPGVTCPQGYDLAERTIITAENPLGESSFVCVIAPGEPDNT